MKLYSNRILIYHIKTIVLILSLLTTNSFAQTVYKLNEVDQVAEPSGGMTAMNQFVVNNLQIPIASAAKGLNGKVFVQGIVELDGSMSDVKVVRSLDEGADQEVLRILKYYSAWHPAEKDGKAVRLEMVYPVAIRTEPIPFYNIDQEAIIEYFDKKNVATTNVSEYKFRNFIPIDAHGYARADVLYQERKGDDWKTKKTIPFTKEEKWSKLISKNGLDSTKSFITKAADDNFDSGVELVTRQENGQLLAFEVYKSKMGPPVFAKYYYQNGLLKDIQQVDDGITRTTWYDNGQLKSITLLSFDLGKSLKVLENWDKQGNALVANGNGNARIDGVPQKARSVFDEGKVVNGNKEGRWTSKWDDVTLLNEAVYENGKFVEGKILKDGKLEAYEVTAEQAGYKGGPNELYKFLGKNLNFGGLNFPNNDKVIVSFVIMPDGTLGNYKVEKSVSTLIDNEVLRVVKLSDGKWVPAIVNGEKESVRYTLPVNLAKQ